MAYIGKIPAAAALTADDISDGIITNAKLAQDIISGETALTDAPADTDEFLVSDAGTLKRIDASLVGGGSLVHLQTQTASSDVSSIAFSSTYLTSTYSTYFITGYVIADNTGQIDLYMHPSIDNGSNYNLNCAGTSEGRAADVGSTSSEHSAGSVHTTFWVLGTDSKKGDASDAMGAVQFAGYLWNSVDYSKVDHSTYTGHFNRHYGNGSDLYTMPGYAGGACFEAGSIVNNIKIQWETGNVETGSKISLFGVKQS